jgi:hypothetical protein
MDMRKKIAIISLYRIKGLVLITERERVIIMQ